MQYVFPDYYKDFQCTAGTCRHSCCIGWEIDIDADTAAYYDTVGGEFGERLRAGISRHGEPHFILAEKERCPFLNEDNLCDIILNLGEDSLCGICADHPRFRNELPDRVETGLGLCCEEAARLILGKEEPVTFEMSGTEETEDEIVAVRDEIISLLQDRTLSIPRRAEAMLDELNTALPDIDLAEWADIMLELERLDEAWTEYLTLLRHEADAADYEGFDKFMTERQVEYEQLMVYFIYRHFANASDEQDMAARACFAVWSYVIVHAIGAAVWTKSGEFSFAHQIELARLFSSEIEYSDDNRYAILDMLY